MMLLRINRRHLLRERHLADLRSSMVRDTSSRCKTHWQYHRWSWHLHKSVRCITSRNEHHGCMLPVGNKVILGRRFMLIYLRWRKPVDQESTRISSRERKATYAGDRLVWLESWQFKSHIILLVRVRVTSGLVHWRDPESQGKDRCSTAPPTLPDLKEEKNQHLPGALRRTSKAGFIGDLCRSTANYGHPLADRRAEDSWPKKLRIVLLGVT